MGSEQGVEGAEEKAGMFSQDWYCLDGLVGVFSGFDRGLNLSLFLMMFLWVLNRCPNE